MAPVNAGDQRREQRADLGRLGGARVDLDMVLQPFPANPYLIAAGLPDPAQQLGRAAARNAEQQLPGPRECRLEGWALAVCDTNLIALEDHVRWRRAVPARAQRGEIAGEERSPFRNYRQARQRVAIPPWYL